jgi:hypothetical protein
VRVVLVLVTLAAAVGCVSAPPALPAPAPAPLNPPSKPFAMPPAWQSKRKPGPPVAPPALSALTWHVLVDQYEPHQKKTPNWQPLAANETVVLEMPKRSAIRCVAPPLEIAPQTNDFESELEAWSLSRSVLCSSDGWHTWTSYQHRTRLLPDGTSELDYRSDGWLSERASDGTVINTVLSLRAEEPRRAATLGPPQVIPARASN